MLGERGRGMEVLEFWEIFVRDLYSRFGNHGIVCNAGILGISKLSVFKADIGFDSRRLPKTEMQTEFVTRFDLTVLSMGKAVAAAVSFWQWRWTATLDRHIAVNSREPLVVARFTLPEISSDILERKAALF